MKIEPDNALLIVDPQNDFMPGGALPVPEGHKIFPVINKLIRQVPFALASQDWHPENHMSFQDEGGTWPPHCVQGTSGAEFSAELDQAWLSMIVRKGYVREVEEYSCFDQTGLASMLKGRGVKRLLITGVATDYCVLWSTLGAISGGLNVFVVEEAIRGVGVGPDDIENAVKKMTGAGAHFISVNDIAD